MSWDRINEKIRAFNRVAFKTVFAFKLVLILVFLISPDLMGKPLPSKTVKGIQKCLSEDRDIAQQISCVEAFDLERMDTKDRLATHKILADLYHQPSQWQKRLEHLDGVLAIEPNDSEYLSQKAWILSDHREYARSIEIWRQYLDLNPQDLYAWTTLGNLYSYSREPGKGIEARKVALSLAKNNKQRAEVLELTAESYLAKYEFNNALVALEDFDRLSDVPSKTNTTRAHAYFFLGKFDRAEQAYLAELSFNPDYHYTPLRLYLTRLALGQTNPPPMFVEDSGNEGLAPWPMPILRSIVNGTEVSFEEEPRFSSTFTREQNLLAANCEIFYYQGVAAYFKQDRQLAKKLFQKSVDTGFTEFNEWSWSKYILENWEF